MTTNNRPSRTYADIMRGADDPGLLRTVEVLHRTLRAAYAMEQVPVAVQTVIDQAFQERQRKLEQPAWPTPSRFRLRLPRRLGFVVTPALGAVVALALVVSPYIGRQSGANAAAVLRAAAHTAALIQPGRQLQPGEYAYTKSEGAYFDEIDKNGHVWGALVRTTREIWVAADGSGRIRQQSATPEFLAPGDRARWEAAGSPPLAELSGSQTYDRSFGPGGLASPLDVDGLNRSQLLRLANDPAALASAIRAIAQTNSNPLSWEMLTIVGDLLGESAAPPQLRASLYQVAATIPNIELVGTVTDRAGRRGVAVAASRSDERLELIFDPKTSALLAQEETLRHSIGDTTAPPGTPIAYTLYLQSAITSTPRTP